MAILNKKARFFVDFPEPLQTGYNLFALSLKSATSTMPKCDRNGQADIFTDEQLDQVLAELSVRMRSLFAICRYTGCRVSEARQLRAEDLVNNRIIFRRGNTKTKQTREAPIHPKLKAMLQAAALPTTGYLFPSGHRGRGPGAVSRQACDKALRIACDRLGLVGYSTHSFRRSALTKMSNAGIPLRLVQEISGHSDLGSLQRYLAVQPEQLEEAISKL